MNRYLDDLMIHFYLLSVHHFQKKNHMQSILLIHSLFYLNMIHFVHLIYWIHFLHWIHWIQSLLALVLGMNDIHIELLFYDDFVIDLHIYSMWLHQRYQILIKIIVF